MKINKTLATFAATFLLSGMAVAEDDATLMEYVADSCDQDLQTYCSTVTPGEGRLMYCIAAHMDKISPQCEIALFEAATLLQDLVQYIGAVAVECEDTLMGACADVEMGEGRVLECLEDNDDATSDACDAAVDRLLMGD